MTQILLIDDDNQTRTFIAEILTEAGYTVIQAIGGEQGIELYNMLPINLVITDLIMPEKDGLDLIMELRQNSPQVKIIAISGGGIIDSTSYLEIAKTFGAQAILSKPFKIDVLLDLVQKVLKE